MVSQFAVQEGIIELDQFGAQDYADDFVAGPWGKLQVNGKAYGMPLDSAPRGAVLQQGRVRQGRRNRSPDHVGRILRGGPEESASWARTTTSPTTRASSRSTAQAWQAGGHMWTVDGEESDHRHDQGARACSAISTFTQKLIDEDLINVRINAWSDDWNRSLNDGTLASLTIGAWMATNLKSSAPEQSGNWRVAPLPKWTDGGENGSEDGGSSFTITAQSQGHHPGVGLRGVRHARRGRAGAHRRGRPVPVPEVDPEQ